MIRQADLRYRTPPGYVDDFFAYVFDADNLPDAGNYRDNVVRIDSDSDFVTRKIDGMGTVLAGTGGAFNGQYWLKDPNGAHVTERPIYSQIAPAVVSVDSLAVLPERIYPRSSIIWFDLLNVQKQLYFDGTFVNSVPASQLIFTGVKRYPGKVKDSNYKYRLLPYAYTLVFTINWDVYIYDAFGVPVQRNSPQQFYVPIDNLDFELWGLIDGGPGVPPPLPPSHAKLQLYDSAGRGRFSNPILVDWFAYNSPFSVANAVSPPILYPVGSQIKLDIYSMMFGPGGAGGAEPLFPLQREWTFFGAQRVPVGKGGTS